MFKLRALRVYLHLERRNLSLMSSVHPSHLLPGFLSNVGRVCAFRLERLSGLVTLMNCVTRGSLEVTNLRLQIMTLNLGLLDLCGVELGGLFGSLDLAGACCSCEQHLVLFSSLGVGESR